MAIKALEMVAKAPDSAFEPNLHTAKITGTLASIPDVVDAAAAAVNRRVDGDQSTMNRDQLPTDGDSLAAAPAVAAPPAPATAESPADASAAAPTPTAEAEEAAAEKEKEKDAVGDSGEGTTAAPPPNASPAPEEAAPVIDEAAPALVKPTAEKAAGVAAADEEETF